MQNKSSTAITDVTKHKLINTTIPGGFDDGDV